MGGHPTHLPPVESTGVHGQLTEELKVVLLTDEVEQPAAPPRVDDAPEEARLEEGMHLLIGETSAEPPAHERADRGRRHSPAGTPPESIHASTLAPDRFFAYAAKPD